MFINVIGLCVVLHTCGIRMCNCQEEITVYQMFLYVEFVCVKMNVMTFLNKFCAWNMEYCRILCYSRFKPGVAERVPQTLGSKCIQCGWASWCSSSGRRRYSNIISFLGGQYFDRNVVSLRRSSILMSSGRVEAVCYRDRWKGCRYLLGGGGAFGDRRDYLWVESTKDNLGEHCMSVHDGKHQATL